MIEKILICYILFCLQEIAELYEQEQDLEQAINYYEEAADFFRSEKVTTSANQCKQKIVQFAAQLTQSMAMLFACVTFVARLKDVSDVLIQECLMSYLKCSSFWEHVSLQLSLVFS